MSDAKAIADDIVSAFAAHNFNLTWSSVPIEVADDLRAKIADAILDERKRCAKLADDSPYPDGMDIAYLILNQGKPNE